MGNKGRGVRTTPLRRLNGIRMAARILCLIWLIGGAADLACGLRTAEALNGQGGKSFHFLGYKVVSSTRLQVWFDKNLPSANVSPAQFALYKGTEPAGVPIAVRSLTPSAEKNQSIPGMPTGSSYIMEVAGNDAFTAGQTYTVALNAYLTANNKVSLGAFRSNRDVVFAFAMPRADGSYDAGTEPVVRYWVEDGASGVPAEGSIWFALSLPAAYPEQVAAAIELRESGRQLPFDPVIDAVPEAGARSYRPMVTEDGAFFFLPLTGSGGSAPYDLALGSDYELVVPEIETVNGGRVAARTIRFRTAAEDIPPPMSGAVTGEWKEGHVVLQWSPLAYAGGYLVEESRDPYWGYQQIGRLPGEKLSYTVSAPEPGITMYYRVSGMNGAGTGGASECLAVTMPRLASEPAAPVFSTGSSGVPGASDGISSGKLLAAGTDGIARVDGALAAAMVEDPAQAEFAVDLSPFPDSDAGRAVRLPANLLAKLKQAAKPVRVSTGDVELTLPAGGLPESSAMTVGLRTPSEQALPRAPDHTVKRRLLSLSGIAGDAYLYEMASAASVSVKLPLEAQADPAKLAAYVLNADTGRWDFAGGIVRDGKLRFKTSRFSAILIAESQLTFDDLKGHWAREEVERMAAKQVVNGVSAGFFAPEQSVSRAEFAVMLMRTLRLTDGSAGGGSPAVSSFADIFPGDWYEKDVAAAAALGIIQGEAGRFRPAAGITRQEMAVMLERTLLAAGGRLAASDSRSPVTVDSLPFADRSDIDAWALQAVDGAVDQGIVHGGSDRMFRPNEGATRAEAAAMLKGLLDCLP